MNRHQRARMVCNHAEDRAIYLLERKGFTVTRNGNNDHADLTINGTLSVEVKGATWTKAKGRKGRYQFNTRQVADVYILCCIGDITRCFVMPGRIVAPYANVAIWSQDPRRYAGRWETYLENWHIIDQELER